MKDKRLGFTTLSVLLVALLVWAVPLRADNVDERIQALENELSRLKTEQEQVKSEQMTLRKDALAAEAALPKFEYRAGDGMTISAADESWQFNISLRLNIHMYNYTDGNGLYNFDGEAVASDTDPLEFYPRRVRLYMNYCWEDCFYEFQTSFDGEQSPRNAQWRDNEIGFHFEKWNPYFPYFSFGLRRGAGRTYEARSSSRDAKLEHFELISTFNWGSAGSHAGAGLGWDRVPVGVGDAQLFLNWASSRQETWQDYVHTDRSGMMGFVGMRPFSKLKDQKWIRGLDIGLGWQFQAYDDPAALSEDDSGAVRIRMRNTERRGRQTWFQPARIRNAFGDQTGQNVGGGFAYMFIPGFKYNVGPYQARFNYMTTRFASNDDGIGGVFGSGVEVAHQIFVWSPKGWFTGSSSTPGSILLGYAYEHGVMSCGHNCDANPSGGAGDSAFTTQSYVLNQTALWYWIRPAMRIGVWWNNWGFANTPGEAGVAVGCSSGQRAFAKKGSDGSCWWNSVNLGFQTQW